MTKQQELAIAEPQAIDPLRLVENAVAKGLDPDTIAKLMALAERWQANESKRQFQAAMQKFKSDPPQILKNRTVEFETTKGTTRYRHATLDHLVEAVTKRLGEVGIYHHWETQQATNSVTVTCVLEGFGHQERTTLSAPPDASGGKNSIQSVASTVTYLERYTLFAATGLAAGDDDDGRAVGGLSLGVDRGELAEKIEFIINCSSLDELQKFYKEAYRWASKVKDVDAMRQIVAAKDQRKRELMS